MGHGLRYGLGIGLLIYVPGYLNGLAGVGSAYIGWAASAQTILMLIGLVQCLVCGMAVAQLYKPNKA